MNRIVPFKTPLDYFQDALGSNPDNINKYPEIQKTLGWEKEDCDLHIYPFTHAKSAILSMGCRNTCKFCPTAAYFKGQVVNGDPEIILPNYEGQSLHFMDEDFFNNPMENVLPLLKKLNITWLAMTTYKNFKKAITEFGEDYLYECGCRCVEMGLENVALMMKCDRDLWTEKIQMYFLNMTLLPGENKATIKENANWMKDRSVRNPIHYNNGVWYAAGQLYFPYSEDEEGGQWTSSMIARTRPTWIPYTLLNEDIKIVSLEEANYFTQLVSGLKMYPSKKTYNIREFIFDSDRDVCYTDWERASWLLTGLRSGAIL